MEFEHGYCYNTSASKVISMCFITPNSLIVLLQGVSSLPSTPKTPRVPPPVGGAGAISPPPAIRPGMIKATKGSTAAFSSQYAQYLASMVGKTTSGLAEASGEGDGATPPSPMEGKDQFKTILLKY